MRLLLGVSGTVSTLVLRKEEPQLAPGSLPPQLPPSIPLICISLLGSVAGSDTGSRVASPTPAASSPVLKPKDQTQAPPCTNATLVRPISEIAAECFA